MALEVEASAEAPIPLAARFRAGRGEILALVGPSGSGKSTLLRTIAGLYRPAHGRVVADGETWLDTQGGIFLPPHRRRVGLVPQSYALFPHMTAEGNVAASLGDLPRADRADRAARAREILALVHLAGLEGRRPAEMSGGQQQRVAVARALAREPRALLLDEPFSAVDRATRERLYREIAELRRALDMPVVLVTHDMDEAARLADRMVVLLQGRTLQEGPPLEVMTRPATPEVARLVGLRNVFTARVAARRPGGGIMLDWAGLTLEAEAEAAPGAAVDWTLPDGFVVLHRRDRPSRGEHENPVAGRVVQVLVLGQTAHLALAPDHAPDLPLHFSVPLHVATRNGIVPGVAATVSLIADGIHLMSPRAASGTAR
jgi:molybdate transport system ATP-binding protein